MTRELGLMSRIETFGQRCCVVTVDPLPFPLAFLYYRGWKVAVLDLPAFLAPRGGHVLAKKM